MLRKFWMLDFCANQSAYVLSLSLPLSSALLRLCLCLVIDMAAATAAPVSHSPAPSLSLSHSRTLCVIHETTYICVMMYIQSACAYDAILYLLSRSDFLCSLFCFDYYYDYYYCCWLFVRLGDRWSYCAPFVKSFFFLVSHSSSLHHFFVLVFVVLFRNSNERKEEVENEIKSWSSV